MLAEKLKPCPFCLGSADFRTEDDDGYLKAEGPGWLVVVCESCGARTDRFFCEELRKPNIKEAMAAWNMRGGVAETEDIELVCCGACRFWYSFGQTESHAGRCQRSKILTARDDYCGYATPVKADKGGQWWNRLTEAKF